jgi:anaerobic magnesium-protoporphyrin IX monomethyl ester cyclase
MRFLLINPNLIVNEKDMLTTGIVYLPIGLCYASSFLNKNNIQHNVIDLFGSNPTNILKRMDNFIYFGEDISQFNQEIRGADAIFIYANQVVNHLSLIDLKRRIRMLNLNVKIFFFENTQAVTAYSLKNLHNEFIQEENDFIIVGDPENKMFEICSKLLKKQSIENHYLLSKKQNNIKSRDINQNIESLGFPNWDCIPIKNYWKIGHAHGPQSTNKYLSLLTSRGCPYPCKFCIIPEISNRKWRYRTPNHIVEEMLYFNKKYNVTEFHIEDLNPTVNEKRIVELCNLIINTKIKFNWKIVAGTKVESLKKEETISLMAKSGCSYISISPESGSKELMRKINKPFDVSHAIKTIHFFNKYKIFSQACFVLGFPGETPDDIHLTKVMIRDLVKNGIDEIALFIITPIPGSEIFNQIDGYENFSQLNFSPTWRSDYKKLSRIRIKLYIYFLFLKVVFFPIKTIKQCINFFSLKFETKMEMVPFKFIKNKISLYKYNIYEKKKNCNF